MNERYEIYENYRMFKNGFTSYTTDDEDEAYDIKKNNKKYVVYDNLTNTFLE